MTSTPSRRSVPAALLVAVAWIANAQPTAAQSSSPPATISVGGGASAASQKLPAGQLEFGLRVPLKTNAENILTVVAADELGRTATAGDISIAQIALGEIVRARVTAERLTTQEIRALVADGTIKLADPTNYNVSRFIIALTVGGKQVEVPVPVVRPPDLPIGTGEPITIGCGRPGEGLKTTDRAISIPCGNGGGGAQPIMIIPFEIVAPDLPTQPSIPGVILIEGRIKTLKEFYKVTLLLQNLSEIFTVSDIIARLDVPESALTQIAPASGTVSIADLGPGEEGSGQFIVRGDEIGLHTIVAHFGAKLGGPFLAQPVPISGSASTDVEVRGPPKLAVKVSHPDHVVANEPYDLVVEITNTDPELDALYTSLALDIGADARLIDPETEEPLVGPVERTLGDILKGQSNTQTYRVLPLATGPITSCTAAASQNLQLTVAFLGPNRPGCAIGTLPADRTSPDGKPTVTVVPAHNTVDVAPVAPIVAIFSAPMITNTITTGFPEATVKLLDSNGEVVGASVRFSTLFGNTAAIVEPTAPLALAAEYSIVVDAAIFSEDGLSLASGMVARFLTIGAAPPADTDPPEITLIVEPPVSPNAVPLGQLVPVIAESNDNMAVTRVELYLDDVLIDAKTPSSPVKFLVDTSALDPTVSHLLRGVATDAVGNRMATTLVLQIAHDNVPPTVTAEVDPTVLQGKVAQVTITAIDDGRVDSVEAFLDANAEPVFRGLVAPYGFALQTTSISPGPHTLRIVATDGASNQRTVNESFQVVVDDQAPLITLRTPEPGFRLRSDGVATIAADAVDNVALATLQFFVDSETTPRAAGPSGFLLSGIGLAPGNHTLRIRATDTAANVRALDVGFEVFVPVADSTPPPPPNAALIFATAPENGATTISGLAGAVEGRARVVLANVAAGSEGLALAAADGSFAAPIEGAPGQAVTMVAVDEAGNPSLPTTIVLSSARTLTSILVSPSSVMLTRALRSQSLAVTGVYSDSTTSLLTQGIAFTSLNASIASTAGALVLAGENGSTSVRVAVEGVPAVDVPVSVNIATITDVLVTPDPMTLSAIGVSQQFTIRARFSDGGEDAFPNGVGFGSGNLAVAIVDSAGRVTATGFGATVITITPAGFASRTVPVSVSTAESVGLEIVPPSWTFTAAGETVSIEVLARFDDGSTGPLDGEPTFASRDILVASVDSTGLVTAVANGSTIIDITADGFAGTMNVTVDIPPLEAPPAIDALDRPRAAEGDRFAIRGRNFGAVPVENQVFVNGLTAEVVAARSDELVAVVPRDATTGPVQVNVGGRASNQVTLGVYARRATSTMVTAAVPSGPGPLILDVAGIDVHANDRVLLSSAPDMPAPLVFAGTLSAAVDSGGPITIAPSASAVDLTNEFDPGIRSLTLRLDGAAVAASAMFLIVGPDATGAIAGEHSVLSVNHSVPIPVTFTNLTNLTNNPLPDGTVVAVSTQGSCTHRNRSGVCINSAGGRIFNGMDSPALPGDARVRNFVVSGGRIDVLYDPLGTELAVSGEATATVSVLPTQPNGTFAGTTALALTPVTLTALDTVHAPRSQSAVIADGLQKIVTIDLQDFRDTAGHAVPNVAIAASTLGSCAHRDRAGSCLANDGGEILNGVASPEPAGAGQRIGVFTIVDDFVEVQYRPGSVVTAVGTVGTAQVNVLPARPNGTRIGNRSFSDTPITLSSAFADDALVTVTPPSVLADNGDNRVTIVVTGIVDASGNPVPNGTRIAVSTLGACHHRDQDTNCIESAGGMIKNGLDSPDFPPGTMHTRVVEVIDGQVAVVYSAEGVALATPQTATARIAFIPARSPSGQRIGNRAFAVADVTLAAYGSATGVANPPSLIADSLPKTAVISVTNIRDEAGNLAPDGAVVVASTRGACIYRDRAGVCINSAGGIITNGEPSPDLGDNRTRYFVVNSGQIEVHYDPQGVLVSVPNTATATISLLPARPGPVVQRGTAISIRAFATVNVTLTSPVAAPTDVTAVPGSIVANGADHRVTVTVGNITDAQGRRVPDGTRVVVSAVGSCIHRDAAGNCINGTGGTIDSGTASPEFPGDARFRVHQVADGSVAAVYNSKPNAFATGQSDAAVVQFLPATPAGVRIGNRAFAVAPVTVVGMGNADIVGPGTVAASGTATYTVSNVVDLSGAPLPDGTKVVVSTRGSCTHRDAAGSCISSAEGTIDGGEPAPELADARMRVFTITGGGFSFQLLAPASGTSVLQLLPANSSADSALNGRRIGNRAFAVKAVSVTP